MKKRSATENLGVGKRGGCSDTKVPLGLQTTSQLSKGNRFVSM